MNNAQKDYVIYIRKQIIAEIKKKYHNALIVASTASSALPRGHNYKVFGASVGIAALPQSLTCI